MEPKIINSIAKQVARQFPEMAGVQPKVTPQTAAADSQRQPKSRPAEPTYLLTFQCQVGPIPRLVRVVVSESGKILKITTSR
jgi:hypothetical protein